jgi:dynamin-binding protein
MSSSVVALSSNNSNPTEAPQGKSKRQHVLFELLETERIYSSDMALVKAVHLPLALGLKIDFGPMSSGRSSTEHPVEIVPSRSSGVSTNTASSTPSQSGSSGPAVPCGVTSEVPMSVDDAKVIFANLDELAEFAGRFTELIQLALGAEIDGGEGPDKVGELFLQMVRFEVI